MRKFLLNATVLAATLCPVSAWAITFTGTFGVDYQNTDPGLVVHVNPDGGGIPTDNAFINGPGSVGSFVLDKAGDTTGFFPLFNIWSDETAINPDDVVAKPISVDFTFTTPPPGFGGTVSGQTEGVKIIGSIGVGVVDWSSPIVLAFGNGGELLAQLSDAVFGTTGLFHGPSAGGTVNAAFTLLAAPSAVPIPPAAVLFASGLVGMAFLARRRSRKPASPV